MKYYIVKSINLPFEREFSIYNNWLFVNKISLLEAVRKDLQENVLFENVRLKLTDDGSILVNDSTERWLQLHELEMK